MDLSVLSGLPIDRLMYGLSQGAVADSGSGGSSRVWRPWLVVS
jgi:hypothetical protein